MLLHYKKCNSKKSCNNYENSTTCWNNSRKLVSRIYQSVFQYVYWAINSFSSLLFIFVLRVFPCTLKKMAHKTDMLSKGSHKKVNVNNVQSLSQMWKFKYEVVIINVWKWNVVNLQ